MTSEEKLKKLQ